MRAGEVRACDHGATRQRAAGDHHTTKAATTNNRELERLRRPLVRRPGLCYGVGGRETYYRPVLVGHEGRYESRVLPGFWLQVEWLWQEPLPPVLDVLRALGVI